MSRTCPTSFQPSIAIAKHKEHKKLLQEGDTASSTLAWHCWFTITNQMGKNAGKNEMIDQIKIRPASNLFRRQRKETNTSPLSPQQMLVEAGLPKKSAKKNCSPSKQAFQKMLKFSLQNILHLVEKGFLSPVGLVGGEYYADRGGTRNTPGIAFFAIALFYNCNCVSFLFKETSHNIHQQCQRVV